MKKSWVFLVILFLMFFSMSVNAIYFPEEINDEMIGKWVAETKEYKNDSSLQLEDSGHLIQNFTTGKKDSEDKIIGFNMVSFETIARKIMEKSHKQHRQYKEPSVENLSEIINNNAELKITQSIMYKGDRVYRDTDDMHLVFKIISNGDEKIIQPERVIQKDEGYQNETHMGIKVYGFSYDKFPSHQEYINGDYDISAIFISYSGEDELDVPWNEIR